MMESGSVPGVDGPLHPLAAMSSENMRAFMSGLAKLVDDALPPKTGFVLVVAPHGPPGERGNYVSNVVREDGVRLLEETAESMREGGLSDE